MIVAVVGVVVVDDAVNAAASDAVEDWRRFAF